MFVFLCMQKSCTDNMGLSENIYTLHPFLVISQICYEFSWCYLLSVIVLGLQQALSSLGILSSTNCFFSIFFFLGFLIVWIGSLHLPLSLHIFPPIFLGSFLYVSPLNFFPLLAWLLLLSFEGFNFSNGICNPVLAVSFS